jgi:hypothetical protein
MFADWLATLGVSGAAWIGLVLILVWRGGRAGGKTGDETGPPPVSPRLPLVAAAMVAVLGLLPALVIEAAVLNTLGARWIGRWAARRSRSSFTARSR